MVFRRGSRRAAVARRRPFKRRRAPIRRNLNNYYKFTRWDHTVNHQWFISRPTLPVWQTEANPDPNVGGLIYSLKCIRPEVSLSRVISNNEFIALFRWFKIVSVTTYIDLNFDNPPEFMAQKLSDNPPITESAETYAPPNSGQAYYRPSRLYRVCTWYDKTSQQYLDTDTNRMQEVKQIPSLRIHTARKRVVMKCRPKGLMTGQISGQTTGFPTPVQRPMIQTRSSDWISTDQARTNFFGSCFGIIPLCGIFPDIPAWWGVNFSIDQKYVVMFKGTR